MQEGVENMQEGVENMQEGVEKCIRVLKICTLS